MRLRYILNSIDGIHARSISFYFGEKAPGINVELIQKYVANDLQSIGGYCTVHTALLLLYKNIPVQGK